jgi:hypothetical protein
MSLCRLEDAAQALAAIDPVVKYPDPMDPPAGTWYDKKMN